MLYNHAFEQCYYGSTREGIGYFCAIREIILRETHVKVNFR